MRNLSTYLENVAFFPIELRDTVNGTVEPDSRKKLGYYHKPGRICPYIWYLESGLIRIYTINEGKETTLFIQDAHEIFISPDSSLDRITPSRMYIQALEDSAAQRATMQAVDEVIAKDPRFDVHYKRINARYRREELERQTDLRTLGNKERFEKLLDTHPSYFKRVPHEILWEYLGMTKNTFLPIKKEYGL